METLAGALLAIVALTLGACTTLQNQSRVDPRTVMVYSQGPYDKATCPQGKIGGDTWDGAFSTACMRIVDDQGNEVNAYKAAIVSPNMRNRVADQLLKQSDDVCTLEMGRLTGDEAIANTLLSTATSGFSIASTAVAVNPLKTILGAFASFTNSTRDHVRAEIYRNFVSYVLIKAIAAARQTKIQAIRSHYGDTLTAFNPDYMIQQVNEYHHLCSLSMGFTLVDAAVSKSAPDASTRRDTLTVAINELQTRIDALNREIADPKVGDAAKVGPTSERDALITQQTELYKSRAAIAAGSDAAPPAPPEDKAGTNTTGTTGTSTSTGTAPATTSSTGTQPPKK
jgi:hypothetical protein